MKKLIILALLGIAFSHGVQGAGGSIVTDDESPLSGITRITSRWTATDAKYSGVDMQDTISMITIERAYTSPIGYNPN